MPAPKAPDGYMTGGQAARALGVATSTICKMIKAGRLPHVSDGWHKFVPVDAVEAMRRDGAYNSSYRRYGEDGDTSMIGRRFGRLTVEEFVGRNARGVMRYRCRCDCGGERVATKSELENGRTVSCGCAAPENGSRAVREHLSKGYAAGTQMAKIAPGARMSNNTSGVRGVSFDKASGRWDARIAIGGKSIRLGKFDNLEDAARARRQAEEAIFAPVIEENPGAASAYDAEDHEGTRHASVTAMCAAWGVRTRTYYYRRERGWTLEEALTGKRKG